MKHVKHYFGNLEEVIGYASQETAIKLKKGRASRTKGQDSFYGCESFERAVEICREGLDLDLIKEGIRDLAVQSADFKTEYSVTGAFVDIGSYLSGDPECMVNYENVATNKMIDVVIDTSEHAGIERQSFTNKTIAAASIVDRLESMNYRVRVRIVSNANQPGAKVQRMSFEVVVKDYEQNLSVAQLMGSICQSFYRRIIFACKEVANADQGIDPHKFGYGFSYSETYHDCVYLPRQSEGVYDWSERKNLKTYINQILAQYATA